MLIRNASPLDVEDIVNTYNTAMKEKTNNCYTGEELEEIQLDLKKDQLRDFIISCNETTNQIIVGTYNGKIVATGGFVGDHTEKFFKIILISSLIKNGGRLILTKLLNRLKDAEEIFLESSLSAIGFYKKFGFVENGEIDEFLFKSQPMRLQK